MKNPLLNKTCLSPFVAVAFAVIGVTGVLLFFHVKNGPIMALHEWFGWLFVIAGVLHVSLNVRPLLAYFQQRAALVSLGVALVLAGAIALVGAGHDEHHDRGRGPQSSNISSAMP